MTCEDVSNQLKALTAAATRDPAAARSAIVELCDQIRTHGPIELLPRGLHLLHQTLSRLDDRSDLRMRVAAEAASLQPSLATLLAVGDEFWIGGALEQARDAYRAALSAFTERDFVVLLMDTLLKAAEVGHPGPSLERFRGRVDPSDAAFRDPRIRAGFKDAVFKMQRKPRRASQRLRQIQMEAEMERDHRGTVLCLIGIAKCMRIVGASDELLAACRMLTTLECNAASFFDLAEALRARGDDDRSAEAMDAARRLAVQDSSPWIRHIIDRGVRPLLP